MSIIPASNYLRTPSLNLIFAQEIVDSPVAVRQKPAPPRRVCALATFAFGGRLVVVLPKGKKQSVLSSVDGQVSPNSETFGFEDAPNQTSSPEGGGELQAAQNVRLYSVADILQADDQLRALNNGFIGPLDLVTGPSRNDVMQYTEHVAAYMDQYPGYGSLALLWRLLGVAVRHNGRTSAAYSGLPNQPENTVCIFNQSIFLVLVL